MSMHAPLLNIGPYLYQPKHQIDETKMSTLWVALEQPRSSARTAHEDRVVLKIARMSDTKYSLTNQRAIENEEKWLTLLRHPNIVHLRPIAENQPSRQQVYRARSDLPGNPWFLVTDFLSGGDLSSVLAERRKLPAALALEITERVADAIAYLHAHNCVHCDIKPRNILFRRKPEGYQLSAETQPIVIDFGIAKNPTEGRQLVSGTPRWITPEMAQAMAVGAKMEVDPSWDIYALGLVLYNTITGKKPRLDLPGSESWERVKPIDLASDPSVVNAKVLAEGLNTLLTGATADDHRQRLSARAFLEQVHLLRNYVRVPAERAAQQGSRRGLGIVLGGVAAALGLGALLWLGGIFPSSPARAPVTLVTPVAFAATPVTILITLPATPATSGADGANGPRGSGSAPNAAEPPDTSPANVPPTATSVPPTATSVPPTATPTVLPATRAATPTARPTIPPTVPPTARPTVPPPAVMNPAGQATGKATNTGGLPATSTPAVPTSTPIKTSTPLPTATATRRPPASLTPTPATAAPAQPTTARSVDQTPTANQAVPLSTGLSVALLQPVDGASGNGKTTFAWRPNTAPGPNDCFELRFWEGSPDNWAGGFGLAPHGQNTQVTVDLTETMADAIGNNRLRSGITYYWGVLHVQCDPYKSPQNILSGVRRFTYQAP